MKGYCKKIEERFHSSIHFWLGALGIYDTINSVLFRLLHKYIYLFLFARKNAIFFYKLYYIYFACFINHSIGGT